jgi:hypothetical protein
VATGIARAQACCRGRFACTLLAVAQCFKQGQPRKIGQAVEEPSTDKGSDASHVRHTENDSSFAQEAK